MVVNVPTELCEASTPHKACLFAFNATAVRTCDVGPHSQRGGARMCDVGPHCQRSNRNEERGTDYGGLQPLFA